MPNTVDSQTRANLYRAHFKDGVPPEARKVPFRNIRDLLALHSKTSGGKPFLIYYDDDDARLELSYAEFTARVHQAANFLYDDLGVRRGDRVATITYNHIDTVIIYLLVGSLGRLLRRRMSGRTTSGLPLSCAIAKRRFVWRVRISWARRPHCSRQRARSRRAQHRANRASGRQPKRRLPPLS